MQAVLLGQKKKVETCVLKDGQILKRTAQFMQKPKRRISSPFTIKTLAFASRLNISVKYQRYSQNTQEILHN